MMTTLHAILLSAVFLYLVRRGAAYRNAVKSIQGLRGHRVPIAPYSVLGMIIRRIPGVCSVLGLTLNTNFVQEWGYDVYAKDGLGWDIRSMVTMLPAADPFIFLADAAAIKEVMTYRARFSKPVHFYDPLSFFGQNIVASEGEQWKKYRRAAAPAFTERNNKLVWEETTRVMNELFEGEWKGQQSITVDHCLNITHPIALFVISCAAFGQNISWGNDRSLPLGHKLSFKQAIRIMSEDFFIPLIVPKWALGLTKRTETAGRALDELRQYLFEMIHCRLHTDKVERHDLFSMLLEENSQHLHNAALTDDELIGNIFLFLIAGHEASDSYPTTSHTLAFALGLLALYPDEQERLYQHVQTVLTDGRSPTYADVNSLSYSLAVFQETLRLFPPVSAIPKVSTEDTTLPFRNLEGDIKRIPVPKGTYITIHVPGVHYNPRYWPDPKVFKPSRFLEPEWPREAFIPFSGGARACLGRRFSEIEAVVVLTSFVSKYKITIKEEPQFANETFEQRKARVLSSDTGLSLTPLRVPLVFTRR
ncbi:614/534 cytochrome P450 [Panaeolus papilionaceus]|nr:614/534 cytochrome P450 [Panaeolus papilionaceus]